MKPRVASRRTTPQVGVAGALPDQGRRVGRDRRAGGAAWPRMTAARWRAIEGLIEAIDRAHRDEGPEPTELIESRATTVAKTFGWSP